jgi:peptide/nickel transport system substrate-binding protein
MKKRCVCLFLAFLVSGVLVLAACGQPAATTVAPGTTTSAATSATTSPSTTTGAPSPTGETPRYGGTLNLASGLPITQWDPTRIITGTVPGLYLNSLWEGDWARGIAGGYGTKETDWGFGNNDIFDLKMGIIAESWNWTADAQSKQGTIVYQVRPDVHWALNPNSEASRLVNGREVTADDVVFSLDRAVTWNVAFVYSVNAELRNTPVTKTGPREVTVKVPLDALYNAITRFGDAIFIVPPEVVKKYGDLSDWKNQVGTGPFIIKDFVTDSMVTAERNDKFWLKNPIGPGKGDQLPYVDRVKVMVVPDASTRLAALRTGKVDQMGPIVYDDANELRKSAPNLVEVQSSHFQGRGTPYFMRTDTKPFDDVKVRRAMNMAVDREGISKGQYDSKGDIFPFPFAYVKEYDPMYYKQADWTPEIKDIYTYNPEKAKQLLAEAGYPNGFKTEVLLSSTDTVGIDTASILKEMWSKIGADVEIVLKDAAVVNNMRLGWQHPAMTPDTTGPVAVFVVGNSFYGKRYNLSILDKDQAILDHLAKVRALAYTDLTAAMQEYREMTKYALGQAFHVVVPSGPQSLMYWPWVRNYSGEQTVGYDDMTWPMYIWVDQDMKGTMGY